MTVCKVLPAFLTSETLLLKYLVLVKVIYPKLKIKRLNKIDIQNVFKVDSKDARQICYSNFSLFVV